MDYDEKENFGEERTPEKEEMINNTSVEGYTGESNSQTTSYGGRYYDTRPEYNTSGGVYKAPAEEKQSNSGYSQNVYRTPEADNYGGAYEAPAGNTQNYPGYKADNNAGYNESPYPYANYNPQRQMTVITAADDSGRGRRKKKKEKGKAKIALLLVICCVISAVIGAFSGKISDKILAEKTSITTGSRPPVTIEVNNKDTSEVMTAAEVYAKYVNSTVGITTSITTNYFGWTTSSAASGSGFIISEDGYIMTNYHVIEDSDSITVTTYNNDKYTAKLVGFDESNDLAVLKIDGSGLTPVVIGDSSNLNVGDDVIAIGNPLGELTFSLTKGTVSALDREITISTGYAMKLIQTDCAINSGNSGGALFNMYGEVIGITNAKYSGSSSSSASIDNIGFAIPLNTVTDIVKNIIEKGTITRNYIGIETTNYSSYFSYATAAVVKKVDSGSPAEKAGFAVNDIITKINGQSVSSSEDVNSKILSASEGDTLTFTIYRNNAEMTLDVTVITTEVSALQESGSSSGSQQNIFSWSFGF